MINTKQIPNQNNMVISNWDDAAVLVVDPRALDGIIQATGWKRKRG